MSFTISDQLRSVEVQMPAIPVDDHFEVFIDKVPGVEFGRGVVKLNGWVDGSVARKKKKLDRVVVTPLEILKKAWAKLELAADDLADKLQQHKRQCVK